MPIVILALLILLGLIGSFYTFGKDRIFGTYYFFLFVYAVFPIAGYYYFPELSQLMSAYFGTDVWYESSILVLLSLLSILLVFSSAWKKLFLLWPFSIKISSRKKTIFSYVSLAIICLSLVFQVIYLCFQADTLSYTSVSDDIFVKSNSTLFVFLMLFKLSVGSNYILYNLLRTNATVFSRSIIYLISILSFPVFLFTAFILGNRTDILALCLGIFVYEMYRIKIKPIIAFKSLLSILVIFFLLTLVESSRSAASGPELDILPSLIAKDYYAPAHMLFAAVSYSFVEPFFVLSSNAANSLFLLNFPLLQSPITDLFAPGVATRSTGYAFYVLTEGYLVAGVLGFLYNAFSITFLLSLWRRLASTSNPLVTNFVLGLMGCMIVNLVRGQTAYFIKYLYTFVMPVFLLYLPLVGHSFSLRVRFNRF
jgi:hypothetical protein